MTKTEFLKLEPFNEEKYKKGALVVILYGNEPTKPQEQRYFDEHPEPVVLKIDDRYFSYSSDYAKSVIRMLPDSSFTTVLDYATEDKNQGLVWFVQGRYGKIASFLDATDESKELAEEYAEFLNEVEEAYNEMQEEADSLYTTCFVNSLHNPPVITTPCCDIY